MAHRGDSNHQKHFVVSGRRDPSGPSRLQGELCSEDVNTFGNAKSKTRVHHNRGP